MDRPLIIVGAGQAGMQTADALRSGGYAGPLLLLGAESHPPYHRPPLSKAYLLGETTREQLTIRSAEALAKKGIEFLPGSSARGIDRAQQRLELSDGRRLDYAGLCLATGARPRPLPLPGGELPGVLALRTIEDSSAIAERLRDAQRVVIVGGGFIGLEVAAVARKLGKDVVVLEAAPRLMVRAVAEPVSDYFLRLHADHGVRIHCGAQVVRIEGNAAGVRAVATADGQSHPADLVLAAIGIVANDDLARAAGLACEAGIVVDECSRTADPQIVAAGDCTARRLGDGRLLRLESVQNAVEQGRSAAASLLGNSRPFTAAAWFWSDQYDVKLQMAGLSAGHDRVLLRGEASARSFSILYYGAGRLLAVDSINSPADHLAARKLLDHGVSPAAELAADPARPLASFLS